MKTLDLAALIDMAVPEPGVRLEDFYSYMPSHSYMFVPSRELWPASSVNARIPPVQLTDAVGNPLVDDKGKPKTIKASAWLDEYRAVEQMSWAPGRPMLIDGWLIEQGGWIERPGCNTFNLYRPPTIEPGDPDKAGPWIEHAYTMFPEHAEHIIRWFAHRVQKPDEKINHALVLQSLQGVGKDTLIEGVSPAVGPWNMREVGPDQIMGRFNPWIKSVILRVSEARDLGDSDRYRFYEHMKTLTAAPPAVLLCDEKNLREHSVPNICGVVITTNHVDGIYLPADDRRHYVAWSDLTKDDFPADYFPTLYGWFEREGYRHIAAYLGELDISDFSAKAPPPKTEAFWRVVDAGRAPEDSELADVLDKLQRPEAITLGELAKYAGGDFADWLKDRRNARQIPHRMEAADYVPVRNPGATDGRWKVDGKRQAIYAQRGLTARERFAAAGDLVERYR